MSKLGVLKHMSYIPSYLVKFHVRWRCLDLPGASGLRCPPSTGAFLASSEQHAAHHIHQWIAFARDLDSEILLAKLCQRIVPDANVLDMRRIVCAQLPEKVRVTALDCKEQHADKVD